MSLNLDWDVWTQALLQALALPEVGLGAVFVVALVSATLVPMGSEPAVWALVKLQPELFWPAIGVATLGNTLGGAITWWMGRGAHQAWLRARAARVARHPHAEPSPPADLEDSAAQRRAKAWLTRWGAPACLLAWLAALAFLALPGLHGRGQVFSLSDNDGVFDAVFLTSCVRPPCSMGHHMIMGRFL